MGEKGCEEVGWGVFLCLARSFRSAVGGAAEEAASGGRGFEDPTVNPARRLGGKHIAKRQQDCSLPVTVVGRSEAGLLRVFACSRAACESIVPE